MTDRFDVVVIGAGIHGAGVAQAVAAAGYSVRVLEKTGIAAATSCRSSKLIHGGLRYLESGQYRLVRESLRERETLLRIAPQLVERVPFHIPVYKHTSRSRLKIRAGLTLYSLFGGFRRESRFDTVPRADWDMLDGLDTAGLKAVFRYHDARTDDARLTHAVMRSAQTLGAELVCPAEFLGAERRGDGWRVRYRAAQGEAECACRALVNATGPWVKLVLARITPAVPMPDIELVQGSHVVVDGTLHRGVYYTEAEDKRAVFVMPWRGGLTLIGTTETPYSGDPAQVAPRSEEIDYLLRAYRRYFPQRDADIRDRFAGLRVLPKNPGSAFGRSRETLYMTDNEQQPRLVSVVGGKLTGYRVAAEKVVALLAPALPARTRRGDTRTLPLGQ
jgi:glycerol-3-phosphate dehydrogenase